MQQNIWELRMVTEDDQNELGMRVACALYAENNNREKGRYDMICFRAYDAERQKRIRTRNGNKSS